MRLNQAKNIVIHIFFSDSVPFALLSSGFMVSIGSADIKECAISLDWQIYLDAGNKDEGGFYNGCLELYKILVSRNIAVQNHIFEGHHNIEYIKENLEKYLIFYAAV